MTMSINRALLDFPHPYLTDAEFEVLWKGTANSRYSKVKRMIAQGTLLHIRRGLYCVTDKVGYLKKPHSFELAQYIYGPSYISLESALSFHNLIPEAVYTTTSVTHKRSKEFQTPLGIFSYQQIAKQELYAEVELVKDNKHQFFIAKPWKAICDYIFCYRKDWNSLEPLVKSLRINLKNLPILRNEEIQILNEYYHQQRVSRFLKGIKKDLNTSSETSL